MKAMKKTIFQDAALQIDLVHYKQGYLMPPHQHDFLSLSLLMKGNLVEDSDGLNILPQTGSLSIKPEGILHSDVFIENCTFLSLKIFDAKYFSLNLDQWQWIAPGLSTREFLAVLKASEKRTAIRSLGAFLQNQNKKAPTPQAPKWLIEAHRIVCQHYKENLRIQEIAKEVGKHPFHLARSFEQYYGLNINAYKKNIRLHHALSDAVSNGQKLTELAYEYGFADQSHFCRDFKKLTSLSPKKALKLIIQ
jgi:AraC-like DNA-binding protein/quercetin dioxygenase-like cupin family protein